MLIPPYYSTKNIVRGSWEHLISVTAAKYFGEYLEEYVNSSYASNLENYLTIQII